MNILVLYIIWFKQSVYSFRYRNVSCSKSDFQPHVVTSEQGKSPQTESFAEMKHLKLEDKSIFYAEKQFFLIPKSHIKLRKCKAPNEITISKWCAQISTINIESKFLCQFRKICSIHKIRQICRNMTQFCIVYNNNNGINIFYVRFSLN